MNSCWAHAFGVCLLSWIEFKDMMLSLYPFCDIAKYRIKSFINLFNFGKIIRAYKQYRVASFINRGSLINVYMNRRKVENISYKTLLACWSVNNTNIVQILCDDSTNDVNDNFYIIQQIFFRSIKHYTWFILTRNNYIKIKPNLNLSFFFYFKPLESNT